MTELEETNLNELKSNTSEEVENPIEENGSARVCEAQENQNYVLEAESPQPASHKTFSPVLLVTLASLIAAIGGILFGYDIGIISGALLLLKKEFSLNCFEQEMAVSAVLIGALFASFVGGNVIDQWGRKCAIVLSSFLYIGGAFMLSFSYNFAILIAGRLIVGVAVSISVTAECTYISEISPPNRRGMMVSLNEVGITVGFLLAYLCNYLFISHANGWRFMFGAAIVPALIQVVGIIFIPQSPHYLIVKGKSKEAESILKTLRQSNVEEEMKAISSALEEEKIQSNVGVMECRDNQSIQINLGRRLCARVCEKLKHYRAQRFGTSQLATAQDPERDDLPEIVPFEIRLCDQRVEDLCQGFFLRVFKSRRYMDLFSSKNNMRARMTLGMVLVFLQQFSGHANVLYYAPSVFQHFGYCSDSSATLVTVGLGVVKVVSTCFTVVVVDRLGRRLLLLVGCILMAISIVVLGLMTVINSHEISTMRCTIHEESKLSNNISSAGFETIREKEAQWNATLNLESSTQLSDFLADNKEGYSRKGQTNSSFSDVLALEDSLNSCTNCSEADYRNNTNSPKCDEDEMSLVMKLISVISLMTFVCAYGISYGPVTWLVLSEIFPTALRGRAISVATCVNWGSNIIVSLTFLDLLGAIGIGETFLIYGFICAGAACFVFLCIPETKNKSLEEITCQLSKGFLQKRIKPCVLPLTGKYSIAQPRST